MKSPPRGEVWLVDLGLAAKVRPCLVLSVPIEDADRTLVALVPHTTSPRSSRFEAAVGTKFLKPGAFDAQGMASVPLARLVRRVGVLSPLQVADVERVVQAWLGLRSA